MRERSDRRTRGGRAGGAPFRVRAARLAGAAALLAAAAAGAQTPPSDAPPVPDALRAGDGNENRAGLLVRTSFGLGGVFRSERWSPVRFAIDAAEPVSGTITLTYRQDAVQDVLLSVPFAATPGVTTTVDAVVCLVAHADGLSFTFRDADGRLLLRRAFETTGGPLAQMPYTASAIPPALLFVESGARRPPEFFAHAFPVPLGEDAPLTLRAVLDAEAGRYRSVPAQRPWAGAAVGRIAPGELPLAAMAYDGFDAVVLRGDDADRLDPRALDALHRWTLAGGRLVLIAGSGSGWQRLAPFAPGSYASLGPQRSGPLPESAAAALVSWSERAAAHAEDRGAHHPLGAEPAVPPTLTPPPGEIAFRPVTLAPLGERHGWHAFWPLSSDGAPEHLGAWGPVGAGMVMVLGVDPDRLIRGAGAGERSLVWAGVLEPVLDGALARAIDDGSSSYGYHWSGGSGSGWRESEALASALDAVADAPYMGGWAAALVLLSGGVLLLLVGPVDALLLRALRARQHSWATALGWTALASALAITLPLAIRTGDSTFGRLVALDRVMPAPGETPGPEHEAWASGVAAWFAGEAGPVEFEPASGDPPPAWWRGVSPLPQWDASGAATLPPLLLAQGWASDAPAAAVATRLAGNRVPLWSLRTLADHSGVAAPALGAHVTREGDALRVRVVGLPKEARVRAAALRTRAGSAPLELSREGSVWTALVPDAAFRERPPGPFAEPDTPAIIRAIGGVPPGFAPWRHAHLPGASARDQALRTRVASGAWAEVRLLAEAAPLDIIPARPARQRGLLSARIVAPLDPPAEETPP